MLISDLREHKATDIQRNRLYHKALDKGDDLMFCDAVNLVSDDYYCQKHLGLYHQFELAKDIYSSCSFDLTFLDENGYKNYREAAFNYFQ